MRIKVNFEIRSIELIVAYIYRKQCILTHITIVLRVIVIVIVEYSLSVVPKQRGAPVLPRERQIILFVVCKTIAGSHGNNQPVLHRKTFETQMFNLHLSSFGVL